MWNVPQLAECLPGRLRALGWLSQHGETMYNCCCHPSSRKAEAKSLNGTKLPKSGSQVLAYPRRSADFCDLSRLTVVLCSDTHCHLLPLPNKLMQLAAWGKPHTKPRGVKFGLMSVFASSPHSGAPEGGICTFILHRTHC